MASARIDAGALMFDGSVNDTPGKFHCQEVMYRNGFDLAAYVGNAKVELHSMLKSMVEAWRLRNCVWAKRKGDWTRNN